MILLQRIYPKMVILNHVRSSCDDYVTLTIIFQDGHFFLSTPSRSESLGKASKDRKIWQEVDRTVEGSKQARSNLSCAVERWKSKGSSSRQP